MRSDWAGWLPRRPEDACWQQHEGPRASGIFYQLLDSDLGLEIKIMDLFKSLLSQERSLGVSELRFQSGTTSVQWIFFLSCH